MMPTVDGQQSPVRAMPSLEKRFAWLGLKEGAVRWICFACAVFSVLTTVGIVYVLLSQSLPFFQTQSLGDFLTGTEWVPREGKYGVLPLLCGSLLITVGSALISVPLGLLTALYLSEYAPVKVRRFLKPALELLAGIPTVVYGYFALFFVTPMLQKVFPSVQPLNAASGAIVVGIMTLPLVSSLCEDALTAVPKALREGAYALGATKFEVCAKIVVPAGLSGIVASFILALSRAVGETMAVTLAAGATPNLTLNPAEQIQTMTAFIVNETKGDVARGTERYYALFAVGLALFAITLLMNYIAQRMVRRFRQVYS